MTRGHAYCPVMRPTAAFWLGLVAGGFLGGVAGIVVYLVWLVRVRWGYGQ